MAFSADELRVLRRALAIALHPMPLSDEDVQDCLRLAGFVDEAVAEAGSAAVAFLLSRDLSRYRNALPGSATGYLELLEDALAAGYGPRLDDLAARGPCAAGRSPPPCWSGARCSPRLGAGPARRPHRRGGRPRPARPAARPARRPGRRPGRGPAGRPGRAGPSAEARRPPDAQPSEVFPPRRRPAPPPSEERAAG
ncbi:hypothetical protein SCALM49S_01922 [Streptomyces californicus]